jgi:DNA (cytosine-5)-methyltransferase 1
MTFVSHALNRGGRQDHNGETFVAAPLSHGSNPNSNMAGRRREDDENLVAAPLEASDGHHGYSSPRGDGADNLIAATVGVRRLTPRECERLQALPDDWTAHGPDSRRYAALGDAVTATVAEWIGRRILSGL